MPFESTRLLALIEGGGFQLWYYETSDSRATVLLPGYFSAAANILSSGDIIILRASDSMAFLPVRSGGSVGSGLILDSSSARLDFVCTASASFAVTTSVVTAVRSLRLDALPLYILPGTTLSVAATVAGDSQSVRFTILDSAQATVTGPVTSSVVAGRATAQLLSPKIGTGYTLRVEDVADSSLFDVSPSFSVTSRPGVMTENSAALLTESRNRLVL
ncbi:hypothetical protein [Roseomonas elaeocarpi]|uniref:Uncharacterized protein n=1 Tax=Roseomonas elaeocarpi TaxID=907779 RepID=A0ABV6JQJ6_9PROT